MSKCVSRARVQIRARFVRFCQVALAASLAVGFAQLSHAQSSYVLTVLKPGASGRDMFTPSFLDGQNVVWGSTEYYEGVVNTPIFFLNLTVPVRSYKYYASRWPASTAASVAPAKIGALYDQVAAVSSSGQKWVLYSSDRSASVVDVATGSKQLIQPAAGGLTFSFYDLGRQAGVNDLDWVAGYVKDLSRNTPDYRPDETNIATLWKPGQPGMALPMPSTASPDAGAIYYSNKAYLINGQGMVAGVVRQALVAPARDVARTSVTRAVAWVNGVPTVLDERPGRESVVVGLSEAGHVLLCGNDFVYKEYVAPATEYEYNGFIAERSAQADCEVRFNGATTKLAGTAGKVDGATGVNKSGVVVGVEYTASSDQIGNFGAGGGARAVMWVNGVKQDLTAYVKSKGARLPFGVSRLTAALAINDAGSILATYADPFNGKPVFVRIQARP